MIDHAIFGGWLRSERAFPGLRPVRGRTGDPTWELRIVPEPAQAPVGERLGEMEVERNVYVRLYRLGGGYRFEFDDTGTFDIAEGGAQISWTPGADARPDAVELDLTGRVLGVALQMHGFAVLHGSGIAVEGRGIAFLGAKHFGKSTLAKALALRGAKLATDDDVVVDIGEVPLLLPGVPRVRLWSDAAQRLLENGSAQNGDALTKSAVEPLPASRLVTEPVPLAALYVLAPRESDQDAERPAVARERLSPQLAAVEQVNHSKLRRLLGPSHAPVLLERACVLATRVPVYRLDIVRDLDRLDEVVARLMEWHGYGAALPAAGNVKA